MTLLSCFDMLLMGSTALAMRLCVSVCGMLMRGLAMLMSSGSVLLRLIMLALRMMAGCLPVVVRGRFVMPSRLMMGAACLRMAGMGVFAALAPDLLIELVAMPFGSCRSAQVSRLLVLCCSSALFCHRWCLSHEYALVLLIGL